MDIRTLQESDRPFYSQLWANALVEHNECFRISSSDEPSPQIPTKFSRESFTLGAFINAELVGSVSVERDMREKLKHKALLFRMFVHASAAGKGVGRALVKEALMEAKRVEGLKQLYLTVLDTNERARDLYASFGFAAFAYEPESVKINSAFVGELQMVCFLNEVTPALA